MLKQISKKKYNDFIQKNIGTVQEILIEKRPSKKTGKLKGVTRNYLTIETDSEDLNLLNTLHLVKIEKLSDGKLYGYILKKAPFGA